MNKHFIVVLFSLLFSTFSIAQTTPDHQAIVSQAKAFSKAFVDGDIDTIMAIYSPTARIVDVNEKIESDINAIRKFWAPNTASKWKMQSHITNSQELIVDGNMASDIGYYQGVSRHEDGREVVFGGAYVIVWMKINGTWRMHLDMWNDIKQEKG